MKKIKWKELLPDYSLLPKFRYTDEIDVKYSFVGQERAREALELGISITHQGYNVFVVGPTGTGRRTFVMDYIKAFAERLPTPDDLAYVYNFEDPSSPKALKMKAGMGRKLKKDMEGIVEYVVDALKKVFESDEYSQKKNEIEDEYTRKKNELWERLREQASELGFSVQVTPTGVLTIPIIDGKPITPELFEALPEEKRKEIEENSIKLKHLVEGAIYKSKKLDAEMKEKLQEIDRKVALFAIGDIFRDLKRKYGENEEVVKFLEDVREDILNNINELRSGDGEVKEIYKIKYSVNLIVDNSELDGAPVVYEQNPTYGNLLGKIEYTTRMGVLVTDFTMIKSGALHRANGGFLVLDADRVLRNMNSWDGLKRVLQSGTLKIENLEHSLGFSNTITLAPEPVEINVKVIMIGTPYIYYILHEFDEDFKKLFKVKAEFDGVMEHNEKNVKSFVVFIESFRKEKELIKVTKDAVKSLIWYSQRLAGSRDKLSTSLGKIGDILIEASYMARKKNKNSINSEDIYTAFLNMERRVRLIEEKYDEMIAKKDLLIETNGEKVGQVNGLTVLEIGDHSFGVPVKITAKVYLGKTGLVDIQREADLSGKIHTKAVMTLESFFNSRYGKDFPVTFGASLSFEQVYSMVEGDSASLAEVLALISAISGIPIRQYIAVTGSINQNGEVQPVGGVTEKVEGFYRACKHRGFNGMQGVIIPASNLKNLVLKKEVVESIKKGEFHIWTVENVDEAIEIVTGKKAGKPTKTGRYPKGTVNRAVQDRLKEFKDIAEGKRKRTKK